MSMCFKFFPSFLSNLDERAPRSYTVPFVRVQWSNRKFGRASLPLLLSPRDGVILVGRWLWRFAVSFMKETVAAIKNSFLKLILDSSLLLVPHSYPKETWKHWLGLNFR